MNYLAVVKKAWTCTSSHRALWVFGILLALVTFSWELGAFAQFDGDWEGRAITVTQMPGETVWQALQRTLGEEIDQANLELRQLLAEELGIHIRVNVVIIGAILFGITFSLWLLRMVARYVSETALIRMVAVSSDAGERPGVRQGLRLAWSRAAWRMFLIDLRIAALIAAACFLGLGTVLGPVPLWVNGSDGVIFTSAFLTGGLFLGELGWRPWPWQCSRLLGG